MRPAKSKILQSRSGFNLVELLTVIAVIAVLASLLLTAIASAKRKSRSITCTSNLHQFVLGLDMYLDDSNGKRPSVNDLATGNYLPSPKSLICPEDKTGNWGELIQTIRLQILGPAGAPITYWTSPTTVGPANYSYLLHSLNWDNAEWKALVNAGGRAGIAACQLHGLGNQNTFDIHNYSGLLLRAQLDGSVIRRQFFWSPLPNIILDPNSPIPTGIGGANNSYLYPLQIYFDDPIYWQGYK